MLREDVSESFEPALRRIRKGICSSAWSLFPDSDYETNQVPITTLIGPNHIRENSETFIENGAQDSAPRSLSTNSTKLGCYFRYSCRRFIYRSGIKFMIRNLSRLSFLLYPSTMNFPHMPRSMWSMSAQT